MELVYFLAPGALTWLVAEILSGKKEERGHRAFMEFLLYAGIDMGLVWLIRSVRHVADEEEVLIGDVSGKLFWFAMLVAFLVGLAAAILRKMEVEMHFVESGSRLFNHVNPKVRKTVRTAALLLAAVLLVFIAVKPRLDVTRSENSVKSSSSLAREIYRELDEKIEEMKTAGENPENLESFKIKGVEVKRVTADMHWNSATQDGSTEAVYMADGNGDLVYYSFRNKDGAATWSGPSSDQEFLDSHGGWSNGMGAGWTGALSKKQS